MWRDHARQVYARSERRVRRLLILCVVSLVATGCRDAAMTASSASLPSELLITESPSPYRQVTAGEVTARLPDHWHPSTAGSIDDPTQGLLAGPRPNPWRGDRPPPEGFAAVWIDGTRVGVPSDYYYLAATGPALDMITGSSACSARAEVIANHRPEFASGKPGSPGDYVARGVGTCSIRDRHSRWAYFVAAPGYGPVREVGIPSSGLYVVVALMPDTPKAPQVLGRLLKGTEFGGASVEEFIAAAAAPPRLAV
jgi:hypothetical protein